MQTIHTNDKHVVNLARKAFPHYNGKKYQVQVVADDAVLDITSHWDSGSRRYYAMVSLDGSIVRHAPQSGTPFDGNRAGGLTVQLLPQTACVEHNICRGKDFGLTVIIRQSDAAPLLPAPIELTRDEQIVLVATRSLKSSYGGISNYRFHEARRVSGIGLDAWNAAVASLKQRKLLNGRGAITNEGKNAIGSKRLYEFRTTN